MKQHTTAAAAILSNDVANNATYDVTTVTRNITISNTPYDVYAVDSTVGSITITLPLISTIGIGKGLFTISDYKGTALLRNITINAASGDTILGLSSNTIAVAYEAITLIAIPGTTLWIIR